MLFLLLFVGPCFGSLFLLFNSSARCLDGSPPGMKMDLAPGSKKWVLFFKGGGWCSTWGDCLERSKTERGSSQVWGLEKPRRVLFNSKHFGSFNLVEFQYCDGGSFLGTAGMVKRGEDTLHFSGRAIVDQLIQHLQSSFRLNDATDVLITGISAGCCLLQIFFSLIDIFDWLKAGWQRWRWEIRCGQSCLPVLGSRWPRSPDISRRGAS